LGEKNYPLLTKWTELNMFSFGDNVNHDKLSNSTLLPVCTGLKSPSEFIVQPVDYSDF